MVNISVSVTIILSLLDMDGWHGVFPATPAAEGVPHGGMSGPWRGKNSPFQRSPLAPCLPFSGFALRPKGNTPLDPPICLLGKDRSARTDGEHPVIEPILKKKILITDLGMLPNGCLLPKNSLLVELCSFPLCPNSKR